MEREGETNQSCGMRREQGWQSGVLGETGETGDEWFEEERPRGEMPSEHGHKHLELTPWRD